MTDYTKGPWELEEIAGLGIEQHFDIRSAVDGCLLAAVPMPYGARMRTKPVADLMTAAPDLLNACKDLLSHLPNDLRLAREDVASDNATDYQRTVIAVHAAIAAAEGRGA